MDQWAGLSRPSGLAGAGSLGGPGSPPQAQSWDDQAFSPCGGPPPLGGQAGLFTRGAGGSRQQGRRGPHAQVLSLSWGPFCDVLSAKGGHMGEPNVKGPLSGGEKVAL